jgi:hypothetical protein
VQKDMKQSKNYKSRFPVKPGNTCTWLCFALACLSFLDAVMLPELKHQGLTAEESSVQKSNQGV